MDSWKICIFLSRYTQKRLEHKENQNEYRKMISNPLGHVRILIYIERGQSVFFYKLYFA